MTPSLSLIPSLTSAAGLPLLRWASVEGPTVVLSLAPARPLAEPLDGLTLAAVAVDLLRNGWRKRARLVSPVLSGGCIHQGFTLARETTLAVGAEHWTLRVLTATPIVDSLDWSAFARTLDTLRTLAA